MTKLTYILLAVLFAANISCNTPAPEVGTRLDSSATKWSVRLADAAMSRFDSLMNYQNDAVRWQYDVAMLGQAIDKLGYIDGKYSKYHEDYINYFVNDSGDIATFELDKYNLDNVNPAKGLITLYKRTGEEKYLKAINNIVKQFDGQPRTTDGGFWHKKRYPSQMWLDGLYMSSPFMAQYGKEFNQPQWFDSVAKQITTVYKHTLDDKTKLLYHAWDESREQRWCVPETGRSQEFWGRAMGWYMMAMVDALEFFPEDHARRAEIVEILNNTSEALLNVRDQKTGLWYQVLDKGGQEGNYVEGSASAMFTYAFAKGAKNGYLPEKYKQIANDSFDAIIKYMIITDPADSLPTFTPICAAAGLGGNPYRDGTYNYYITEKKRDNDCKGIAPLIFAAIELDK